MIPRAAIGKRLSVKDLTRTNGNTLSNSLFFESLSPNLQKIVLEAAKKACAYGSKVAVDVENSQLDSLKGKGMTVISEKKGLDLKAFHESVSKIVKERFEEKLGKKLFEEIAKF